jgi:hypothetical protein
MQRHFLSFILRNIQVTFSALKYALKELYYTHRLGLHAQQRLGAPFYEGPQLAGRPDGGSLLAGHSRRRSSLFLGLSCTSGGRRLLFFRHGVDQFLEYPAIQCRNIHTFATYDMEAL